jgi:chromosome segregation ATPase
MEPSKEAIEAAQYYSTQLERDTDLAVEVLEAAYAIDIAPLEKRIAELVEDQSNLIDIISELEERLLDNAGNYQLENDSLKKRIAELEEALLVSDHAIAQTEALCLSHEEHIEKLEEQMAQMAEDHAEWGKNLF